MLAHLEVTDFSLSSFFPIIFDDPKSKYRMLIPFPLFKQGFCKGQRQKILLHGSESQTQPQMAQAMECKSLQTPQFNQNFTPCIFKDQQQGAAGFLSDALTLLNSLLVFNSPLVSVCGNSVLNSPPMGTSCVPFQSPSARQSRKFIIHKLLPDKLFLPAYFFISTD